MQDPDLPLSEQPLYEHLCQGHQPYLSSCNACSRASGRIPARRLEHPKGPYEVALDITFLGPLRILVAVCCLVYFNAWCILHDGRVGQGRPDAQRLVQRVWTYWETS